MPQGTWIRLGEIMAHTKAIIDIRVIVLDFTILKFITDFFMEDPGGTCGELI